MTAGTHLRENVDKGSVQITGLTILGRAPNVRVILQICQFYRWGPSIYLLNSPNNTNIETGTYLTL